MTVRSTPLLDLIKTPEDLRGLQPGQLRQVADELRQETIDAVAVTGGHLGAGLGVIELTVALHYVFDTPRDRLIWDVGHQAYPHKILTGRRDRIRTLRQGGGLSGFTKRAESEYDPFGAAHSSTSISSALGMAVARDLAGKQNNVIAVIGDGAMSAGMAYEAMNNAGSMDSRLIVVLNDNDMSIAPPVGALSAYLARRVSGKGYRRVRKIFQNIAKRLPSRMLEQRALRVAALAHIAADRLNAHRSAIFDDEPARDLHHDRSAVVGDELQVVQRRLGGAPQLHSGRVPQLAAPCRRHDARKRTADHLVARVPERALEGRIDGRDAVVQVDGEDEVARVLDDVAVALLVRAHLACGRHVSRRSPRRDRRAGIP